MKKDITKPEVKHVTLAIARERGEDDQEAWRVYILNHNDFPLENALVTSKGYGKKNGKEQKTSVLRHFVETVPARSAALVEPIDPKLFHLSNEYWLSYYVEREVYDKKFIFLPDSIQAENLTYIDMLKTEAVLHS